MRKENIWLVDSGCSRHMTGDKNWFSSLTRASRAESVTYGDASTSTIVAKASPRASHLQAVKRIFRYLHGTQSFGIWLSASSSISLRAFSDADFGGCRIDRKSTSGTCLFLGDSLVKEEMLCYIL